MYTFLTGIAILILGGALYGRICEKILKPSDAKTPAVTLYDGVDYVPMNKWRNSLIELLNIAGTGPILGPIQGILFGPVAFITIPIGCVIGGALHDYMIGMISVRNDGAQMPGMVKRFLGKGIYPVYNFFVCLILFLCAAVFVFTPGDLFLTQLLGTSGSAKDPVTWVVYGAIFLYFILASLFPIDKIIGKVYPLFGGILLLSAVGIFIGLFTNGYTLNEFSVSDYSFINMYGDRFIPIFFVTVACGIVSGFHSTQATLVSRTIKSERDGRMTFYNMMIMEGFVAMVWAAAAMGAVKTGLVTNDTLHDAPTAVVGIVSKDMLGTIGGIIAIIGVIVFPITTGDTALRALRVMLAEALHLDSGKKRNNLLIALPVSAIVAGVLVFAKTNANGFNVLWRYFAWGNAVCTVFSFAVISVYMIRNKMPFLMALIPGMFYMFIVASYILSARIGFGLSWNVAYIGAALASCAYGTSIVLCGMKSGKNL